MIRYLYLNANPNLLLARYQLIRMTELCLKFGEEQDIELEEVDIGVAEGAIAFDVSGRIVGLDETMLNQVSGKEWVPTELRVEARDPSRD